jgi:hypothetical protein
VQLHPNWRFLRVAEGGVTCGPDGLFVASQNPDFLGQAGEALNRWRKNNRVVYGM